MEVMQGWGPAQPPGCNKKMRLAISVVIFGAKLVP